jgi:succinoglycan biosynthesis protein ExoV
MMQLGYYKAPRGNFGDDLNPWLWPRLLPGRIAASSDTVLIGIGSILDHRFDSFSRKVVLGAGARGPQSVPSLDDTWTVFAVRGPLTAAALGLPSQLAVTDPAVLVRKWVSRVPGSREVGVVPYFRSAEAWRAVCASCGYRFIPPTLPVEEFFEAIRGCGRVLCESLHGAIVADALGIRWSALRCLNQRLEGDTHLFKWLDWCGSLGLEFHPLELPPLWDLEERKLLATLRQRVKVQLIAHLLRRQVARGAFFLSSTEIVEHRVAQLLSAVDIIRDDVSWSTGRSLVRPAERGS